MVAREVVWDGSLAILKVVFGFFSGFVETPTAGVWESAVLFVEDITKRKMTRSDKVTKCD